VSKPLTLHTPAALVAFFLVAAIASTAQTFTTIANFNGSDGSAPYSGLVQGSDGNFYGTATNGGANNTGDVFTVTPRAFPEYAPLIQATDGNFFGTTGNTRDIHRKVSYLDFRHRTQRGNYG
jgi:uncharacterized repeat protein (TIGR03803 family)